MRRRAVELAAVAAAVGAVVLALAALSPLPREPLLDGWVLFVGALLLLALVRATREAGAGEERSLYERALRARRFPVQRPSDLERLEREVVLTGTNAFDVHVRARPLLREIAAHRLESDHGLDLDAGSPATRGLLGEELWELVRPDRPAPSDRSASGMPLERLRGHVERLETI